MSVVEEITDRFGFHPATAETGPMHDVVRASARNFALSLAAIVPPGRHLALALTAAQEAMMWANAGIAIDTPKREGVKALNPHSGKTP